MAEITSFETLVQKAQGIILQLPPFDDGTPFTVRMARPSLIDMVCDGKVYNELAGYAVSFFEKGKGAELKVDDKKFDKDKLKMTRELMRLVAKECLLQPTFDEIDKSGYKLNDEQLSAIFLFSQEGARAIKPFFRD